MQKQPNPQPWWHTEKKETLEDRVNAVQNVNDPTIMSDNILRWAKVVLIAMLAFTTLLSAFSYFKFFQNSFGFELALCMALLLSCIIEFGKNWGFLRVLRIPFFHGWSHIWATIPNTILWAGLLALAVVTFSASVYNSTKGAEQLSLLLGHEKNATVFNPNTGDIDAQIAATEKRISDNRATKWKGTTTVDAMRAIKTETRTLEKLQAQRAERIAQQRADYDRATEIKDGQNRFTAGSVMAVGGWIELLQIILMFVRVAAERSLDKTATDRRNSTTPPYQYRQERPMFNNQQRPIGFNVDNSGNVRASLDPQPLWHNENTVPQSSQAVPQSETTEGMSYADTVLEVCRQAIQRDISNFHNRSARSQTVANRIHLALNKCYGAMVKSGSAFDPSYNVGLKLYSYLQETVFPALDGVGYPFEGETILLELLYNSFKKAEPATR